MQSTLPQTGSTVWIRGQRWRVSGVRGGTAVARIDVTGEAGRRAFLYPFDRPVEDQRRPRPVRVRQQRARARLALLAGRTMGRRTLLSAIDADAAVLPHQLEPALAVQGGVRRILIADDVGLGKTVQAGLIAAELIRRNTSARVLVVVPAALAAQWAAELRSRFGIESSPADRASLDRRTRTGAFGASPWIGGGVWIASLDFLKQAHVLDGLPPTFWDLVVVDEAHAACGRSDRHAAVHFVARRSRSVVLLTATPHSGDEERFARLLRIGAVAGDPIVTFRRHRVDLGFAAARREARVLVSLTAAELRALDALRRFERSVLRAAERHGRDEAGLLLAVLKKRALSTMGAFAISISRRLGWLASNADGAASDGWTQGRLDLGSVEEEDDVSAEDQRGLQARTGLTREVEQAWLQRLLHLATCGTASESKLCRLARLLSRTGEPAIVFTEYRDSLHLAVQRLSLIRRLAILHGGMTTAERAAALDEFQSGTVSVLVATDVAGQGLNLHQRCRWVISLELPWNPMRLEQRIGRVDRIGQRRPVHATLLIARHQYEAELAARLEYRTRTAHETLRDPALQSSSRWRRLARSAARQLEARRRLVRRWRGAELAGRPVRDRRAKSDLTLVFSVPFLDGSGALVELHLSAVRVRLRVTPGSLTRLVVDEAARRAANALAPRLRRARRCAAMLQTSRSDFERLIAEAMLLDAPREAQPGLFDAAARLAFETAQADADERQQDLEHTLDRLRSCAEITAGRPRLEIVLPGLP